MLSSPGVVLPQVHSHRQSCGQLECQRTETGCIMGLCELDEDVEMESECWRNIK